MNGHNEAGRLILGLPDAPIALGDTVELAGVVTEIRQTAVGLVYQVRIPDAEIGQRTVVVTAEQVIQ